MKIRHPEKKNKPINPIKKKPDWIRSKLTNSKEFFLTKTIVNKNESAGRKVAVWYGADDAGNSLSAGMYFYRLDTKSFQSTRKMLFLK